MEFKALFENYAQAGTVKKILLRPARLSPVRIVEQVLAIHEKGLQGDRYNAKGGLRQVTLIQAEHLMVVASILGRETIDPVLIRRNLVIEGINLLALKGKAFHIGDSIFEYSGECHPCSRMEQSLGPGGYNAMRGHGGITAKVIRGGIIKINDNVWVER